MCLFHGNSRTLRWSGMVLNVFCMVIIVLFSCSTSSMCLFHGNSLTFRWSGMVLNVFCLVIIVLVSCSTSSMCLFRGNSRTFRWFGMVLNGMLGRVTHRAAAEIFSGSKNRPPRITRCCSFGSESHGWTHLDHVRRHPRRLAAFGHCCTCVDRRWGLAQRDIFAWELRVLELLEQILNTVWIW